MVAGCRPIWLPTLLAPLANSIDASCLHVYIYIYSDMFISCHVAGIGASHNVAASQDGATCVAESDAGYAYRCEKAIDQDSNSDWASNSGGIGTWIKVELD